MFAIEEQARTLFFAALERPSEEWSTFLDAACGDNRELRARVDQLLHDHREMGSIHNGNTPFPTIDHQPISECPGIVIGPYKLLEQIGEGGFGVVFMAEQTQPLRRKVALKILKPGMDTRQVVARFEAERQALALMDHPNIAHVFDGGETATGRPYFVMELVRGIPITDFCDRNQLSIRARLELFVSVCQAVQHAHQKGIIHRDIKPSNVLVTVHDTVPVVKVIDFGVAKAVGQELTDKTLFTGLAQMVGTPLYMSPEQAGLSGLDVDTRSDIYSLGVLFYELLTGTTPFDKERLRTAGYDEIRRIIREEEAPRPSTRLSTLGNAAATVSAERQSDPKKLGHLLSGELDWIALKALEKDRNRRYESASAFAADVQRYLNDEPVLACPPSAWYRIRKFTRRNKATLATASVVGLAILLAAGSAGWIIQGRRAVESRTAHEVEQFLDRARTLYAEGKLPDALAEVQKAQGLLDASGSSADMREHVRSWWIDLRMANRLEELRLEWFDHAQAERSSADYAKTFHEYGIDVEALSAEETAAQIAARRINADLVSGIDDWAWRLRVESRPDAVALRGRLQTIAQAADADPLCRLCRQAAGAKDVQTLREMAESIDVANVPVRTLWTLGSALNVAGDSKAAIAFLRRVQRHHPDYVSVNFKLVECMSAQNPHPTDDAIGFLRAVLAFRPKSVVVRTRLGRLLYRKRLTEEASAELEEAIRHDPVYYEPYFWLGEILFSDKRDYAAALTHFSRAIDANPHYFLLWLRRSAAYIKLGQVDNAIADLSKAIALAPHEPALWVSRGKAYMLLRQPAKAIAEFSRAIELKPDFTFAYFNRGEAYLLLGQPEKARADFSLAIPRDPKNATARLSRARAYQMLGQWDNALTDCSKAIEISPNFADGWISRAQVYRRLGQTDKALADFSNAIKRAPALSTAWMYRGLIYAESGKWKKAAADLAKLVSLQPDQPTYWYNHAMACLGAGDTEGYRLVCARMRQHYENSKDLAVAAHIVSTCVTAPEGVGDAKQLAALGKFTASGNRPLNVRLLGAALVRADQCDAALECLKENAKVHPPRAWDWLFEALAHHRLGHAEKARDCLSRAIQWIGAASPPPTASSPQKGLTWDNWQEQVAVRALRKEVETFLQGMEEVRPTSSGK
jgi:tetratricopeptide (TPR) repeat protein